MPRGVRKVLPGGDSIGEPEPRDWNRFAIVCGLFLAYETVLIVVFGDYFYTGISSEIGALGMVAAAALGYILLGAMAGSPASFFAAVLPALIAWTIDPPVPSGAWGGEPLPLYQMWILSSYIFLPAWILGFLASLLVRDRREGRFGRK